MPDPHPPEKSSELSLSPTRSSALPTVAAYVQQALPLLGLNVSADQLPSVIKNFERVQIIAQPVLDFPLPDNLEAAPQFEP